MTTNYRGLFLGTPDSPILFNAPKKHLTHMISESVNLITRPSPFSNICPHLLHANGSSVPSMIRILFYPPDKNKE
jgi:hypothetical protein